MRKNKGKKERGKKMDDREGGKKTKYRKKQRGSEGRNGNGHRTGACQSAYRTRQQ